MLRVGAHERPVRRAIAAQAMSKPVPGKHSNPESFKGGPYVHIWKNTPNWAYRRNWWFIAEMTIVCAGAVAWYILKWMESFRCRQVVPPCNLLDGAHVSVYLQAWCLPDSLHANLPDFLVHVGAHERAFQRASAARGNSDPFADTFVPSPDDPEGWQWQYTKDWAWQRPWWLIFELLMVLAVIASAFFRLCWTALFKKNAAE